MIFANTYEDFGISGVASAKENAKHERYVICPSCEPFRKHQGETKLAVNTEKGTWFCQHCGWTGGLTPQDWARNKPVIDKSKLSSLNENQIAWFEKRKISLNTLTKRGVKSAIHIIKQKATGNFEEKSCIVFEYREKGWLMMLKYRDGKKNFSIEKGSKLIPWGIDWIINTDEAIITEGEIDTLSYDEVGLSNSCSVPNGTTISNEEKELFVRTGKFMDNKHLSLGYFDEVYQYFENKKVIYIATDADPAGVKLRMEIGRRFGYDKCKFIDFSKYEYEFEGEIKKCKDANDVLVNLGPDVLKSTIANAEDFPIHDIVTINDCWDDILDQYLNGLKKGLYAGIPSLDPHFSWRFGDLIGINGWPNMGKSYFVFNLTILSSIMYDWKWGMYLPENYPVSDAYTTFMEIYTGNTYDKDIEGRATLEDAEKAKEFIKKHFFFISNDNGYSPEDLRKVAKRLIMKYGINGFVTDPWNALSHSYSTSLDSYLELELSAEQRFAINNNIIKILCVHPPTPQGDDRKQPKVPGSHQITGGTVWFKKLYELIAIHTDKDENKKNYSEIHVQKVKNWKLTGVPTTNRGGPVKLVFNGRTNRFLDDGVDFFNREILKKKHGVKKQEDIEYF